MEQKVKLENDECKLELEQTKEKFISLSTKLKVCFVAVTVLLFLVNILLWDVGNLLKKHECLL